LNGFGFVHQSNGIGEPISRIWNRIFASFIFEKGHLVFSIKPWYRVPENSKDDNNSDVTDYMGHGEVEAAYKWNRNTFAVMSRNNLESDFRKGGIEATWSFFLCNYKYIKGYIQGFTGYGQSLTDYDSNETTLGIGFATTDVL
jgi:phospholipase A1